jgi:hypothetical protein
MLAAAERHDQPGHGHGLACRPARCPGWWPRSAIEERHGPVTRIMLGRAGRDARRHATGRAVDRALNGPGHVTQPDN